MASPELEVLKQVLRSQPRALDVSIEQGRQAFEASAELFASRYPLPGDVSLEPVDAGGVPGAWISTAAEEPGRILYYLHGGAYVLGSIRSHRGIIARLALTARARVLAVDYRLAPECPFPAAVEDAVKAYGWLLSTGVEPGGVAFAGDSAGGGLVVATLLALRDAGTPLPAAAVCLSPWLDLEGRSRSLYAHRDSDPALVPEELLQCARSYLGDADPRHPLATPLHGDLAGLPPLLLQVGAAELLLDDSTRLAELARSAGVDVSLEVWEEMFHAWHLFAPVLPEAQQALERVGSFIRDHTPWLSTGASGP